MSFLIYDYECFGLNPARDGVAQFAGLRVNDALEPIDEAKVLYCKPAVDYLPNPASVLLTGITPQYCDAHGLHEPDFIARILHEMQMPQTCIVGYNNLRFDDEFTRYLAYRNFHDPYAHSYRHGNSRWDVLDVLRAAYALRPEGIRWAFQEEGLPSFRLEDLAAANAVEHTQAHDALSDVWATLAMMRLLRQAQPRLYDYALTLRHKATVQTLLQRHLLQPLLHVSGMFGVKRFYTALVAPITQHPHNPNRWIVCDLVGDVMALARDSVEDLRARLFAPQETQSALGMAAVPLKGVTMNQCPFLAPLATLRAQDAERLGIVVAEAQAKAQQLRAIPDLEEKVKALYQPADAESWAEKPAREQLYAGFWDAHDKALMEKVCNGTAAHLGMQTLDFHDARFRALLWEYRARYATHTLNADEQALWARQVQQRLQEQALPYAEQLHALAQPPCDANKQRLLQQLYDYAKEKGVWE